MLSAHEQGNEGEKGFDQRIQTDIQPKLRFHLLQTLI